jgi:hypothetical protein
MSSIVDRKFNFRSKYAYLRHIERLGRQDVLPNAVADGAISYGLACYRGWDCARTWYASRKTLEAHIRGVLAYEIANAKLNPVGELLTPHAAKLVKLFQIEASEVEPALVDACLTLIEMATYDPRRDMDGNLHERPTQR